MAAVRCLDIQMIEQSKSRVIHVTTVHPWWDNRIYEKMVSMLPLYGWDVTYLANPCNTPIDIAEGVTFVPLSSGSGLLGRLHRNLDAFMSCLQLPKQIIHFHDPEFLPFGILLKLFGRRVIYDIHEDNFLGVMQKPHIPSLLRVPLAYLVAALEQLAVRVLVPVVAEKIYLRRFPRGIAVLNYLKVSDFEQSKNTKSITNAKHPLLVTSNRKRMIYTGSVSVDRGAFNHIELLKRLPDYELYVVGRCDNQLREQMLERASGCADRLHLIVNEDGIPYPEIEKYYLIGGWSWALAVFPLTQHYYEKELTKFFEYIYYCIPVVCSDFPVWSELIYENSAGICVDEKNYDATATSMQQLEREYQYYRSKPISCVDKISWEGQLQRLMKLYESEIKKCDL